MLSFTFFLFSKLFHCVLDLPCLTAALEKSRSQEVLAKRRLKVFNKRNLTEAQYTAWLAQVEANGGKVNRKAHQQAFRSAIKAHVERGTIAVMGPTRMRYSRAIAAVDSAAVAMSRVLRDHN